MDFINSVVGMVGMLSILFLGAARLAAGLHCGWNLASNVFGPLEFTRTERVTKQIFTYRHGADREGDAQ